jgi:hypothetical protein
MSFRLYFPASRLATARPAWASRNFTASGLVALKEGHQNVNEEGRAEESERHKQDQLSKQKEGKNHWKPELASNSEEAVGPYFYLVRAGCEMVLLGGIIRKLRERWR